MPGGHGSGRDHAARRRPAVFARRRREDSSSLRAHANRGRWIRPAPRTPRVGVRHDHGVRRAPLPRRGGGTPARGPRANWLHAQPGGVLSAPTWGKFWLALLGLYGRDGLRPLVPELALLPRAVPVHPIRYYCHTRVRLPRYGAASGRARDVRSRPARGRTAPRTVRPERTAGGVSRAPLSPRAVRRVRAAEPADPRRRARHGLVRPRAASQTARARSQSLRGPHPARPRRDGPLDALAGERRAERTRAARPRRGAALVAKCVDRFEFYRWDDAERGLRYSGGCTRGWDTGFAVEALLANPQVHREPLQRAYRYLADNQMAKSVAGRDPSFPDRRSAGGAWATWGKRGR